ncbi:MAG TPA: MauE/DoxX family redox-associated membrane protein [candidate division Zixibacteria bacterium]|nr:MauE/DoxX family redox-associated membrane protein [candidate division Zixibacteria bacterium]
MRKIIDNPIFILALRIIVAAIFLSAAYSKILDPAAFAKNVNNYHILPASLVNIVALGLPMIEALAALGILAGVWQRASALLINGMLLVFTVALLVAIVQGVNINCGCFTQNPEVKSDLWFDFYRDLVFIALAAPLLFTRARGYCWK